jgi:hypothetical protein
LRLWLGPTRPGVDGRLAAAIIAAVIGIYAVTALVADEAEGPSTVLVLMLAVLVVAWIADGPGLICGLVIAVVGPAVEILFVELELSRYGTFADGLLGVGPWLPPLYLAFGAGVARLAELLVARRPGAVP